MADSKGCERNLFARDIFRPKVAHMQNLSEIEKIVCPYRFGPLRSALLSNDVSDLQSECFPRTPPGVACGLYSLVQIDTLQLGVSGN